MPETVAIMRATINRFGVTRWAGQTSVALALAIVFAAAARVDLRAQTSTPEIPDLVGVWDGGFTVRPLNGPTMPWVPGENFPVLNERGLAYQGSPMKRSRPSTTAYPRPLRPFSTTPT